MHTQNQTRSRANEYFRQRAESLSRSLSDAELVRDRRRRDAKLFTDAGRPVPRTIAEALAQSERKARELRREMERALFNAGGRI